MATKTKTATVKTAKYISRFAQLSIAIKSAHYDIVGQYRVLVEGQRIQFEGGYYETSDEGIIASLETRTDFGSAFVRIPDNKTVSEMHDSMDVNDAQKKIIAEQQKEIDRLNGLKVEGDEIDLGKLTKEQLKEQAIKVGITEDLEDKTKAQLMDLIARAEEDTTFDS